MICGSSLQVWQVWSLFEMFCGESVVLCYVCVCCVCVDCLLHCVWCLCGDCFVFNIVVLCVVYHVEVWKGEKRRKCWGVIVVCVALDGEKRSWGEKKFRCA